MSETPDEPFEVEPQLVPEPREVAPSPGFPWGGVTATVGLILIVVFAIQNTEDTAVRFLWIDGDYPLSMVILVTALVTAVFTVLGGALYRRARRQRRADKAELRHRREKL